MDQASLIKFIFLNSVCNLTLSRTKIFYLRITFFSNDISHHNENVAVRSKFTDQTVPIESS